MVVSSPQTSLTLIRRLESTNPEAWETFVRLYGPLVYSWCRSAGMQPADVGDVAQNVFQVVYTKIDAFEPGRKTSGAFRSWLWGVTRLRILDYFRQRDKQPRGAGGTDAYQRLYDVQQQTEEPESIDGMTSRELLLKTAIEMLRHEFDPRTWQAFWRMAVEGQTASEIAEDLGMKPNAIRQAKFRVTKKLREHLDEDDSELLSQPATGR